MTKDRASDEILYDGEPPLKRSIADCLQQIIERGLESSLTDEQQDLFEAQLIEEWKRGPESRAGIEDTVVQFKEIADQIKTLPAAKQPFGWREVGRQLYMYAEKNGQNDPVGQLILNTYQNKKTVLIPGSPPLSRQAAESYIEMTAFFQGVLKRTRLTFTSEKRSELVSDLSRQFPTLAAETKEQISQADILWGLIRQNWKQASQVEREQFRLELAQAVRSGGKQEDQSPVNQDRTEAEETSEPVQAETDSISPANPEVLSKNSRFIDAVKKLRLNAPKMLPFQFRKR